MGGGKAPPAKGGIPPAHSQAVAAAAHDGTELLVFVDAANVARSNSLPTELGGKRFTAGSCQLGVDSIWLKRNRERDVEW